jgi:hypothetical protein
LRFRRNTKISVIIDIKKNLVLTFAGYFVLEELSIAGEELSIVGHAIFVHIDAVAVKHMVKHFVGAKLHFF